MAEAAKVIENVQRDVNIALINELHQIFTKLQIDSEAVVAAASTKWNFMKLTPGMVGGHCIGIDPYYLINKSLNAGYVPDLIRKAREINNSMSTFYANDLLRKMLSANINPIQSKVLILGVSFKANCPDYRNTKVVEFARELQSIGLAVHIFDPLVDREHFEAEYEFPLLSEIEESYDVVVKAVHHDCFKDLGKAITYSLAYRI